MWDKPLSASIDRLYKSEQITKETVYACVPSMISENDYEKITGEVYMEGE